ncbi:MAG: hypothetical protein KJN63_01950 [Acidimicrobiia bacterium]|nr:hypothetical protein [Acidimicrobiia bacterium]
MAITQADLDQLRNEFDAKLATVTLEHVNTATAIGAYGERFNGVDAQLAAIDIRFDAVDRRFDEIDRRLDRMDDRFERMDYRFDRMDERFDRMDSRIDGRFVRLEQKIDNRFGWQTVMFTAIGLLTLFGDPVRAALGL